MGFQTRFEAADTYFTVPDPVIDGNEANSSSWMEAEFMAVHRIVQVGRDLRRSPFSMFSWRTGTRLCGSV